jgi:hypothetical protein
MRTAAGVFWPIPITLSTDAATAGSIAEGAQIALLDPDDGSVLATMKVTEKYRIDKAHECMSVFKTTDPAHPGVKMVMEQGEVNLAGPVEVLADGGFKAQYGALFMTPAQTRAEFERLGWTRVAAFQTRNPMHRSHEYLAKVAIEVCDGVLVHSLLGNLKPGDIPAEVRTRAIDVLIERYFRPGRTTVAPTRSSGATTPASAATTARSTRSTSSTRSPPMRSRSGRSRSTGRSGATAAAAWPRRAPARTTTPTACWCRARSCASGFRREAPCRRSSRARRCWRYCASTTRDSGKATRWK